MPTKPININAKEGDRSDHLLLLPPQARDSRPLSPAQIHCSSKAECNVILNIRHLNLGGGVMLMPFLLLDTTSHMGIKEVRQGPRYRKVAYRCSKGGAADFPTAPQTLTGSFQGTRHPNERRLWRMTFVEGAQAHTLHTLWKGENITVTLTNALSSLQCLRFSGQTLLIKSARPNTNSTFKLTVTLATPPFRSYCLFVIVPNMSKYIERC